MGINYKPTYNYGGTTLQAFKSFKPSPRLSQDLARHLVKQVLRYLDHLRDPQNEESYGRVCTLAWCRLTAGCWVNGDVSDVVWKIDHQPGYPLVIPN